MISKLVTIIFLLSALLFSSTPAYAFDIFGGVDCGDPQNAQSATCTSKTNENPISGENGILIKITNIIAFVGGVAAIILIIVAAIRFITSGSDISSGARTDTDVEDAKRTIAGALIGLAIIILARALIIFVIKRLG